MGLWQGHQPQLCVVVRWVSVGVCVCVGECERLVFTIAHIQAIALAGQSQSAEYKSMNGLKM